MIGNIYVTTKKVYAPKCYLMVISRDERWDTYTMMWWAADEGTRGTMGGYATEEISGYLREGSWKEVAVDNTPSPVLSSDPVEDDDG